MRKEAKPVNIEDFDFDLPESLIAQTPLLNRESSRLLKCDKVTGELEDLTFKDVIHQLSPGDCLVLNDTKSCLLDYLELKKKLVRKLKC